MPLKQCQQKKERKKELLVTTRLKVETAMLQMWGGFSWQLVLVNDGGGDQSAKQLNSFLFPHFLMSVVGYPPNFYTIS